LTCFAVQVVILMVVNLSQSLLISFAYVSTPSGKESLQSFRVVVAIFSEEGKYYKVVGGGVIGIGITVYYLVRV
jgi:hypothetical protein